MYRLLGKYWCYCIVFVVLFAGCNHEADKVAESVKKISHCKFTGDFACYCARIGGELLKKYLRYPLAKKKIVQNAKKNHKRGLKLVKVVLDRISVNTRNATAKVRFHEEYLLGKRKWKQYYTWQMEYIDGVWKAININ